MEVGDKVKGNVPPHGGKWEYDPNADELTLLEKPTQPAAAEPATTAQDTNPVEGK